ncbi:hypothetical protein Z042_26380 [Chania multitudinisentens RB-25]|uniref:YjiS-like domain-containing protein n=1 Tax=Chania multitudinisentens RB-25 TaxID=1441930 RepID=A0A0D4ZYP0_9GAMM|nr:DUF1127 domain-containing protein [Chania multitudinisentens]AJW29003.1 hypothetical protein Z042_26380 [Chania multitudinisentens RB-25]
MAQPIEYPLTRYQTLLRRLQRCLQRQQTRRALLWLSDAQLADVGLSRAQAMHEWRKPFWR